MGWRETFKAARRLLGYVIPYWQLKAILLLIIVTNLLEIFSPIIIGSVVDLVGAIVVGGSPPRRGVEASIYRLAQPLSNLLSKLLALRPEYALLLVLSLSLIVLASITGLGNYLRGYASAWISQRGSFELRRDLYDALLRQSFRFYDRQITGQLIARATGDIRQIERFLGFGLPTLLSSLLITILVVSSLLTLNWRLTLLSGVVLPLIILAAGRYGMKIGPLWREVRERFGRLTSHVQESLAAIKVVKGFAREDYIVERFSNECAGYFRVLVDTARVRAFYLPLSTLLASFGAVLIIWYGGLEVMRGALTVGGLVAFYLYLTRLQWPLRSIGFLVGMLQRAAAAAGRVFEVIDAREMVEEKPDAMELGEMEGRVALRDVWFSYDGKRMVLRGVSLEVEPGERVAILGPPGSGKTSIINLIPRFYDPQRGSVTIDGVDVRDVKLSSLRRQIGIVRQDPFIFSTTIRENIAYGAENASLEEIIEAAKRARIHDFIESLPNGYETKVGERGVTLSGGERQRIAIARVILRNPRIIILDDSTSNIDAETEEEIRLALEELFRGRTVIIITHRVSMARWADRIVVLRDGQVVEEGSHDELLARRGFYYRLYVEQVGELHGDGA